MPDGGQGSTPGVQCSTAAMDLSPATLPRASFASAALGVLPPSDWPALDFAAAAKRLDGVATRTPVQRCRTLSARYGCEVYLKREDLQVVRSYKLRGAYNFMCQLGAGATCVTASAGNHAQGVAFAAQALGMRATIFMPLSTPKQKIGQVRMWGQDAVDIQLQGDTFDDAAAAAKRFLADTPGAVYVPPFDAPQIVEGQGTVALELLEQLPEPDVIFVPLGGGGLCSGLAKHVKAQRGDRTAVVGVEPAGAPSMVAALRAGQPVALDHIEKFVDGAAVRRVGDLPFAVCSALLDAMHVVPEGRVCSTILDLYNREAMVVEPAGALSIAALEDFKEQLRGKKVVCVVSGSNADVDRMAEIKERSLLHEGLKHYFLVRFAQRAGALREFLVDVLPETADIVRFEYAHKSARESGPALVGLELHHRDDYATLIKRLISAGISYTEINKDDTLAQFLI